MDRRIFIKSLFGVAGTAVAATALIPRAQAMPLLLDELNGLNETGANPLVEAAATEADLAAEGATEAQYYYGPRRYYGPPRRRYARPYYRPVRRRCRTVVNRRGRLVRRCWVG